MTESSREVGELEQKTGPQTFDKVYLARSFCSGAEQAGKNSLVWDFHRCEN